MEFTVDVDLEDILDRCFEELPMEKVLDMYSPDEIREYLTEVDARNRERQEDKEIIFDIFRRKTNRFPDKETVKEVINELIDDLW